MASNDDDVDRATMQSAATSREAVSDSSAANASDSDAPAERCEVGAGASAATAQSRCTMPLMRACAAAASKRMSLRARVWAQPMGAEGLPVSTPGKAQRLPGRAAAVRAAARRCSS